MDMKTYIMSQAGVDKGTINSRLRCVYFPRDVIEGFMHSTFGLLARLSPSPYLIGAQTLTPTNTRRSVCAVQKANVTHRMAESGGRLGTLFPRLVIPLFCGNRMFASLKCSCL